MSVKSNVKKKSNKNAVNFLNVAVCVLVLGVVGYTVLKSHTSLFSNNSAQAEEKATSKELEFTPAEKAAADAEPEASITTVLNQGGIKVSACRIQGYVWNVEVTGSRTIGAKRNIIVINVNHSKVIAKIDLQRQPWTTGAYYGRTQSGYIKFLVGQTGAYRVLKFKTLAVC